MSRVTLHRIESGEASVTIGAYANALAALGLQLEVQGSRSADVLHGAPAHGEDGDSRPGAALPIRVGDYPRLRELAWHLPETAELLPHEALQLYERNWRHAEHLPWTANERALLDTLIGVHGKGHLLV